MAAETAGLPPHGESSVSMFAKREGILELMSRLLTVMIDHCGEAGSAGRRSFDTSLRPVILILRTRPSRASVTGV